MTFSNLCTSKNYLLAVNQLRMRNSRCLGREAEQTGDVAWQQQRIAAKNLGADVVTTAADVG